MTKLLTFYNEVFGAGKEYASDIYNTAIKDSSVNGIYLCLPDFVKDGYLGFSSSPNTTTWYNMLADGNYLSGSGLVRVASSSQFNNKPCIQYNDNGNTKLTYKYPVKVGTLIMVYLVRVAGSYIVFAPRSTASSNPVFYDAFPSGGTALWANETINNGSIYNAKSRINGKDVPPTTFIPLNSTRILAVKNIANATQSENISGYGGQRGLVNGGAQQGDNNSLKGSLAAVITFENNISDALLAELESKLAAYYIQYSGIVRTSTPSFKYLVGNNFSFDFSAVFTDEFFQITNYELVSPNTLGLGFTGSTLTGALNSLYDGKIRIAVTNSANMTTQFDFDLLVCRQDPIVNALPLTNNLKMVLSANKHIDNGYYGLKLDAQNQVVEWEDARRISSITSIIKYNAVNNSPCTYVEQEALFNNQSCVQFGSNSKLNGSTVNAKTFVWVYLQQSYGTRLMLNTFPDIKGTGVLWTVQNVSETHGQTPVTKLNTQVQNITVNTLNFTVPLNTAYIITATVADNAAISFTGFDNMKGKLAFFAAWDVVLNNSELSSLVSVLSQRYANSLAPYIFDTSTEFRNQLNISIDLKKKVTDLRNQALSYSLLTPFYDASIDSNGILTFTAVKDEVLHFSINVTNTDLLTSNLQFDVDISVRPNSLYLNLKSVLGTALTTFFLTESDTLTLDNGFINQWEDYRLNDYVANGTTVRIVSLPQLNDYNAAEFNANGSSYLSLPVANTGKCFGLVYLRKEDTINRAFLFGQTSTAEFISGVDGKLFDSSLTSPKILNASTYVNNRTVDANYTITPQVLNTIFINTQDNCTVNSIAKDRVFNDRSVKGYIPLIFVLNRNLTNAEATLCNRYIRDYYDPTRFVTLLHFDTAIIDSSVENKVLTTNGTLTTAVKKFGTHSIHLVNNSATQYVEIPNDTHYAHLYEDFTISFWMSINKNLDTNDTFSIYSQTDLNIYVRSNTLYVGRSYTPELALLSYVMPSSFLTGFHHVALCRKDTVLTLYINGVSVGTVSDVNEYKDYNTLVRIGQRTTVTTTSLNLYLDEFVVQRRTALHTANFTPPSSPYT